MNTPWLYLDIDRTKCMALGVPVSELFSTLQIYLGSYYVNNFNEFGRTWQVNVQADQGFRDQVPTILQLQVRNNQGRMIRLATLMEVRNTSGPVMVKRYNMYSSAAITGNPAPGTSSGQAIALMQEIARQELPRSMASDWTELAFMQLEAGGTAIRVFGLAVVFVFLVLAAQYESWKLPLAVILVVPMCLLCSVLAIELAGLDVSLFTQIGFVVLVGLASKNAILIVEFAKQRQEDGVSRREATLEACQLRLRPILMTSFAFIFGVVPLVVAEGAGAEMRRSLGTAVFSGMLGVTVFGIFLTPVFYYMVNSPVFAFANVEDYEVLSRVLLEDGDQPDRFFVERIRERRQGSRIFSDAATRRVLETLKISRRIASLSVTAMPFPAYQTPPRARSTTDTSCRGTIPA